MQWLHDDTGTDSLGIVLIAHGSRRQSANEELERVAEGLRSRGFGCVVPSYLELAHPLIVEGGDICVTRGAKTILLLPYFLSSGRHVAEDLERARKELQERYADKVFLLAGPLGPHSLLVDILQQRVAEALVERDHISTSAQVD
ncbi:Sirohydrochlorin cobaltochelatase [Planctomycetes bacterium Pan216]|uniref:Sirohydrochlorin cobaltochelatase n=1 Tax=Kolteria novifilia TaxID=2527975 RepID=A0A518BAR9_9BACT|nr:Sirohydrochlorin cobaltochelatase [Planctomycetes bacterium Pan216]